MPARLSQLCLVIVLGASCTQGGAQAPATGKGSAVVATVNGVALTEADVQLGLRATGHGSDPSMTERRKAVITGLIHDELARQRAVELGLEPEGAGAEELARAESILNATRRKVMAEAYFSKQILKKAEPSDQDARAFFDANAELIRSEYHLSQIFLRDEVAITQAQRELQDGVPFEDVARRQFAGLPEGVGLPWELGFLSWKQLPEPWRPVLQTLSAGDVSGVIRGPGGRFWILKLVERRINSELTFEQVRPLIVEDLRRARLELLTLQADQDLRKSARIVEP